MSSSLEMHISTQALSSNTVFHISEGQQLLAQKMVECNH